MSGFDKNGFGFSGNDTPKKDSDRTEDAKLRAAMYDRILTKSITPKGVGSEGAGKMQLEAERKALDKSAKKPKIAGRTCKTASSGADKSYTGKTDTDASGKFNTGKAGTADTSKVGGAGTAGKRDKSDTDKAGTGKAGTDKAGKAGKASKTEKAGADKAGADKTAKGKKDKSASKHKPKKIRILFVCTGNTCRSPMAEQLFRDFLRRRKMLSFFEVKSAGLYAEDSLRMNDLAVKALLGLGVKAAAHEARQLTEIMAEGADFLVCMTAGHKSQIEGHEFIFSIGELTGGGDVPDPYGGDLARYEAVARYLQYACEDIFKKAETLMDAAAKDNG